MDDRTNRLVARIREEIRRGELRPGERLGSERGLAEHFREPRSAVNRALDVLERSGEIQRRMGGAGGVFASDHRIARHLNTILGVPQMLRQQGFACATSVLHAESGPARPAERRALHLSSGDEVLRLVRRRDAGESPWSLDSAVLPARSSPDFLSSDLTGSMYQTLHEQYDLEPQDAHESIDVVPAPPRIAAALGIESGAPLLEIWRVTRATHGGIMEFSHDFFRADRTRIHMERLGSRWKRAPR